MFRWIKRFGEIKPVAQNKSPAEHEVPRGTQETVSKEKPDKPVWPNTNPPDFTDPYWERNNNMNLNGITYKKAEVQPGEWEWIIDEVAEHYSRQWEQEREDLYWALRTRVLTDDEMKTVKSIGYHLLTKPMVSYREEEKVREFNDALLRQFEMRLIAERVRHT